MKLDPRASLITVEVEIFKRAKSRVVRMALDTGATYLIVPLHVLEALGYAPGQARRRISITTGSGSQIAPLLTLNKVKVLGKAVAKVPAICHGLPAEPSGRAAGPFVSEL